MLCGMTTIASDTTHSAPAATVEAPAEPAPASAATVSADTTTEPTAPAETTSGWVDPTDWPYDWIEFMGDRLAIRIPKGAALQALASARHCSLDLQDKISHRFLTAHLSPASFEHLLGRMIDPDDEVSLASFNDLVKQLGELGAERARKEAEELAKVSKDA